MRLRCRVGIHEWEAWTSLVVDNVYYRQNTKCKYCGIHRVRTAMHYQDRYR